MYSENIRPNDHCWIYDEKQVHLESQLDPAAQSVISPNVEQFIDDKAEIISGADVRKSFVSFTFIRIESEATGAFSKRSERAHLKWIGESLSSK